jgi:hypothetical protein
MGNDVVLDAAEVDETKIFRFDGLEGKPFLLGVLGLSESLGFLRLAGEREKDQQKAGDEIADAPCSHD